MKNWKTHRRTPLLDHSKYLAIEEHEVETPGGLVIPDWPWVISPNFVNVLAQTADERFICLRQGKYGYQGLSYAPVGGYLEPGESPLQAAQRELREETGFAAEDWVDLGGGVVDPNRGFARGYYFWARQARFAGILESDDLEEQEIVYLNKPELEQVVFSGQVKVMAWEALMVKVLLMLSGGRNGV